MSDYLDLRSNEVHEVMNEIPSWIIRLGTGLIFIVFILLLAFSYYIKYADTIQEHVVLEMNDLSGDKQVKTPSILGKMNLSQDNFGRIKVGSEVMLKFKAYPFQEYGTILATISNIATISSDEDHHFEIVIVLPEDGITSMGKKIPYRSGLVAEGEIILNKTTLFHKFIENIFY